MKRSQSKEEWARSLRLIAPNQDGRGAHINISGGGVAKYALNRDNVIIRIPRVRGSASIICK